MIEVNLARLQGQAILLTRPTAQLAPLAGLIRATGGEPVEFATLEIAPAQDPGALREVLSRLSSFDWAVFVSANAVACGLAAVMASGGWPTGPCLAAVGPSTAAAMAAAGLGPVLVPVEGADTEALLALPALQDLRGRRVVIFRGDGGREALATEMRQRGAVVEYAQCYRRCKPKADPGPLLARWRSAGLAAVVSASAESLSNLREMVGAEGQRLLSATALFVPHPRVAERARQWGLRDITVTGPGDAALLRHLCARLVPVAINPPGA